VSADARLAANLRGAGFMTLCMAGFSSNDAMMKLLSADVPLFQAVFLRGAVATALLAGLAWAQGIHRFRPRRRDRRLIGLRCVAEVLATVCFLLALFNMPIADATAILQSVPLAVTLAAALFLGEPVGWRRYVAIVIGFLGVLIIVRPGSAGYDGYALLALAAVVFIVARDLSTRGLSLEVPGVAVAFVSSAVLTASAGLAAAVSDWAPLDLGHALGFALAGVTLLVGYVFGVQAMRIGDIGFVQPFRYALLVWAMLFGIFLFGERPDGWMLVGSAIVVATGLFTLYRERRARVMGQG
jgi:drug/metabolite transporter (DMT)-like permease